MMSQKYGYDFHCCDLLPSISIQLPEAVKKANDLPTSNVKVMFATYTKKAMILQAYVWMLFVT